MSIFYSFLLCGMCPLRHILVNNMILQFSSYVKGTRIKIRMNNIDKVRKQKALANEKSKSSPTLLVYHNRKNVSTDLFEFRQNDLEIDAICTKMAKSSRFFL